MWLLFWRGAIHHCRFKFGQSFLLFVSPICFPVERERGSIVLVVKAERLTLSNKLAGDVACPGSSVAKHQPHLLRVRGSIPGWDVWGFLFLPKLHFLSPFLLSLPLPLSLSLRRRAKNRTSSHLPGPRMVAYSEIRRWRTRGQRTSCLEWQERSSLTKERQCFFFFSFEFSAHYYLQCSR